MLYAWRQEEQLLVQALGWLRHLAQTMLWGVSSSTTVYKDSDPKATISTGLTAPSHRRATGDLSYAGFASFLTMDTLGAPLKTGHPELKLMQGTICR